MGWKPENNETLIDAEQETLWKEIRKAYEAVARNPDVTLTIERGDKRVRIMNQVSDVANVVTILIKDQPLKPPKLITP